MRPDIITGWSVKIAALVFAIIVHLNSRLKNVTKRKEFIIIMERQQTLQKISNLVWDAKWVNRITGWEHFAKVLSESVPGNRVNFSHETIRKWAKGCNLPDYQKMQIVYDHSDIDWTRNLAVEIMKLLRPDLWKEEES